MVVQELTNHTDLQCTHKKVGYIKRLNIFINLDDIKDR